MKRNILLTLLMSLCLSSCILIENPSSNESNSIDVNYNGYGGGFSSMSLS